MGNLADYEKLVEALIRRGYTRNAREGAFKEDFTRDGETLVIISYMDGWCVKRIQRAWYAISFGPGSDNHMVAYDEQPTEKKVSRVKEFAEANGYRFAGVFETETSEDAWALAKKSGNLT